MLKLSRPILAIFGVGILLFLITGGITLKNHIEVEHNRTLLNEKGIQTDAKVVDKEEKHTSNMSLVGSTTNSRRRYKSRYVLHLRYDANSSKGILSFNKALRGEKQNFNLSFNYKTTSISVGKTMYRNIELGQTLPIKYLPENPEIIEHLNENGEYYSDNRLLYSIVLFLLAGLTALLARQYYKTGTTW